MLIDRLRPLFDDRFFSERIAVSLALPHGDDEVFGRFLNEVKSDKALRLFHRREELVLGQLPRLGDMCIVSLAALASLEAIGWIGRGYRDGEVRVALTVIGLARR